MKIGIIGAGNMAFALVKGFIDAKAVTPGDISVSDLDINKLEKMKNSGVKVFSDNLAAIEESELVILAVKPNVIMSVLEEIKNSVCGKTVLSIAAGVSVEKIEGVLGDDKKIVRAMPNTPAMVGCGMTVISPNGNVSDIEAEELRVLIASLGDAIILDEKHINTATALHGSSPAYIYMLIDAMALGGVKHGLPKDIALRLAAKAVEGSAKMVLELNEHPQKLKDDVCSPGGTTIEAVAALERNGFCVAVDEAIDACIEKAERL